MSANRFNYDCRRKSKKKANNERINKKGGDIPSLIENYLPNYSVSFLINDRKLLNWYD